MRKTNDGSRFAAVIVWILILEIASQELGEFWGLILSSKFLEYRNWELGCNWQGDELEGGKLLFLEVCWLPATRDSNDHRNKKRNLVLRCATKYPRISIGGSQWLQNKKSRNGSSNNSSLLTVHSLQLLIN